MSTKDVLSTLSEEAQAAFKALEDRLGKLYLESRPGRNTYPVKRPAGPIKSEYIGIFHSDGTFVERHKKPNLERLAEMPKAVVKTFHQLVATEPTDIFVKETRSGTFEVRRSRKGAGEGSHVGIIYSDGTFVPGSRNSPRVSTKDALASMPKAAQRKFKSLEFQYGSLSLGKANKGWTVKYYDPEMRDYRYLGVLYEDGKFSISSRVVQEGAFSGREHSKTAPVTDNTVATALRDRPTKERTRIR